MKKIIAVIMAFSAIIAVQAQDSVGTPDPNAIGIDTAQQKLQLVSIDKFEAAGFWNVSISADEGVSSGRLFAGGSLAKADEPKPQDSRCIFVWRQD